MIADIQDALSKWRVIHLLGVSTLRGRFARSKLGQFWLSISVFINICIIGVVWSMIWHMPIVEYLPYLGIGQVIYTFASQIVNESTTIFTSNARLYTNQKFPLSLAIFAHVYKNVIILLHNIPILVFLFFLSPSASFNFDWYLPIGILLTFLFLIFSSYALAILCVRFRDLIQIVALLMQSVFLLTPIMWNMSIIPDRLKNLIYLNPFAAILDIFRAPLLGGYTLGIAYLSLAAWCIFFLLATMFLHKKLSKNIVFWM